MSNIKANDLHKPEICAKIAERTDLPLRAVNRFYDAFADTVIEEVAKGKTVHIRRLGKFSARFFNAHTKKHPVTGVSHIIEGRWRPFFHFGETFKRTVKLLGGVYTNE